MGKILKVFALKRISVYNLFADFNELDFTFLKTDFPHKYIYTCMKSLIQVLMSSQFTLDVETRDRLAMNDKILVSEENFNRK